MNIALCLNSSYLKPSLVAMISVMENNSGPIDFYILYSRLNSKEISVMRETVASYGSQYSLRPIEVDKKYFADCPINGRSFEAYFRLLIPTVLPKDVDRCLYIDGDVMVNKSLSEYYKTSFDEKALIVCEDLGEILFFHKERHAVLGIPLEFRYFNSGVLLMNLDYFREKFPFSKISEYIKLNSDKFKFLDQDVLNALFYDKVKFVDSAKYDYLEILVSHLLANDNMNKAVMVHYLKKPWRWDYSGINAKYWWKYGKKVYGMKYYKFLFINFFFRKLLGIALLIMPIEKIKSFKKN